MKTKSTLLRSLLPPVLLAVVGLVLVIKPDVGSSLLGRVTGGLLLAGGIFGIVMAVLSWPSGSIGPMVLSLLAAVLGIYLLANPMALAVNICKLTGFLLLIQGAGGLLRVPEAKRAGFHWQWNLAAAVLTCLLGLVLVFAPISASRAVMRICGIVLLLVGIANTAEVFLGSSGTSQEPPDIIDADE